MRITSPLLEGMRRIPCLYAGSKGSFRTGGARRVAPNAV